MSKVMKFAQSSCLWLLLAPWVIYDLGAASNQAVLIANGDRFPVLVNQVKLDDFLSPQKDDIENIFGIKPTPKGGDMIDSVHCVMSSKTHLNALADIFDMYDATYSIGDGLLYLGEWLQTFVPFCWFTLICKKVWDGEI